ncbi:tyrosine-protein phosphatase Lar-like [Bombyx mandarina]|uniref:protein-tyrosine-phosphatase n=1 Tax=Bombyx mandarina TaxID=7092 RepID=A0A6J2JFJ6_BOMMA|nr:tyrosine-protein phosphatase Lar-like [Bombyx mandarina]
MDKPAGLISSLVVCTLLLQGLVESAPSSDAHLFPPPPIAYVAQGGTVTLKCSATGSPTPTIRWKKGSEWLTPEDNTVSKHDLTLTNVTEEGKYTCVFKTGELVSSVTTAVKIRPLPRTPHSVHVSDVTDTSAQLEWSYSYIPGTDDPTHYHLRLKPKQQNIEPQDITTGTRTSFELTNLTPATEYQVQVIAAGTVGKGPATEPIFFTTKF